MPVQWVKSVCRETWTHIQEAQLLQVASSLAYTTILSIIPVLAVSFAIFQAFGGLEKLYGTIEPFILENLAEGADEQVMEWIRKFIGNAHAGALGAGGFFGLVVTCMSMLSSAERAINRAWRIEMKRPFFHRIASYWLFVTLGPLASAVAIGVLTSATENLSQVGSYLPSGTGIFLIVAMSFTFIYKFVPNRRVHWAPAAISGTVTAGGWHLARWGFSIYTRKVLTYSKIYGSLGAIPLFLLWIYIIWIVVLVGAALAASLQKKLEQP